VAEPPVGEGGRPDGDEQATMQNPAVLTLKLAMTDQKAPFRCSSAVRCARLWNPDAVHLLPADRSDHRVIDAERICQAIAALDSPEVIQARARQFAVLADPTRLTLLTCIRAAGPISVSDLAAATGINDTTVSQTLRYLRASQTVIAEREGRVVRYRLASTPITALLAGQ
jgi:DNA-binding transcriptional ArsR family regulator